MSFRHYENKKEVYSSVKFRNLSYADRLSNENYRELASLVYHTDPYIYPALFGSWKSASVLLPLLFRNQDSMFCLDNCFVAKRCGKIIGLLLWKRGKLNWSPRLLKEQAAFHGIELSPHLDVAAEEYVAGYDLLQREEIVSIINLCVLPGYGGRGIGRGLMESFMEDDGIYELCVLKGNTPAVHLYESLGFETIEEYNGFSIDHRLLPALKMRKENKNEKE